jgi:putative heme-binding domain-containing protein
VTTTSGEVHGGVLRSDTRDEVVIATGAGQEIRIARQTIKDIQTGAVSLMPAGLDEQLTRQELADLLAFLKNTRSGAH